MLMELTTINNRGCTIGYTNNYGGKPHKSVINQGSTRIRNI